MSSLKLPLALQWQWQRYAAPIHITNFFFLLAVVVATTLLLRQLQRTLSKAGLPYAVSSVPKVVYAIFLKPHAVGAGQQTALESFYQGQADVYDATRRVLLRGREDMLGLVAAQLKYKQDKGLLPKKPVWLDLGGGTGYNIEAMKAFIDVPAFFAKIILVDLSPSLLEIARTRFERLGWDVELVCQDVRYFSLEDHINIRQHDDKADQSAKADVVTMSYSLSMIPDYYNILDQVASIISSAGVLGVVDFYVQSIVEIQGRNYLGGSFNRHVTWLGRLFWRAWFDLDRVGLEGARRDYMEYKFGTLKTVDQRNYWLGGIPYYIFLGVPKDLHLAADASQRQAQRLVEAFDASCSETPPPSPPLGATTVPAPTYQMRTKTGRDAIVNLTAKLPLPSFFYQNSLIRLPYDDHHTKHARFNNEYIYTFTWEDPLIDHQILNIRPNSVILCITSAGDNVLDYLLHAPSSRIHAVDLNPNQNHLLELKIAAFQALPYYQFRKLFGTGRLPQFRETLIEKLSPYLSSQACQYWFSHAHIFNWSSSCGGLYETGGSRHAIIMIRRLFAVLGLKKDVKRLCEARTLDEQRALWPRIRRVLLSKPLHWAVISTEWFSWKAAGVPATQHKMIVDDYRGCTGDVAGDGTSAGEAIWQYVVDTLDPVVRESLISEENYFYLLCLQGRYSQRCHPTYLTPKAHVALSHPNAFDGVRIHSDELGDVLTGFAPGSLDYAVIMDSMDWLTAGDNSADLQISALRSAMKVGGKVLLRSAGRKPWYIALFEQAGFDAKRVAVRHPGDFLDRVNMYASTWVCVKTNESGESI